MFHVLNITYIQPLEVVDQSRPAHLEWLADLVEKRLILLAGRLESQGGAVLIASDMSAEEADALTAKTFLVEDFLPERIDFKIDLAAAEIRLGDTPDLTLAAKYLFGAPGADLAVEGAGTPVLRGGFVHVPLAGSFVFYSQ